MTSRTSLPGDGRRSGCEMFFAFGTLLLASGCQGEENMEAAAAAAPRAAVEPAPPLAFPGAEGHGRGAVGGRGGAVMFVTNLEDDGPGSLRACIDAAVPRVCIFRVGGVIRFKNERPLVMNPFITIAGQTAPGDGILLTHSGGETGRTPIAIKNSHDVIVRHVRVRPDVISDNPGSNDAFTIENSRNVILDHVSGSWALDENVNAHGDNDAVTISWSVFAEGVPPHDKCALLGSDATKPMNISFLNNVCAHNGDRSPDVKFPDGSCAEIINNVFYNAVTAFAEIWEVNGGTPVSFIGNYFKAGPDTIPGISAFKLDRLNSQGDAQVFLDGNYVDEGLRETSDETEAARVSAPACPLTVDPAPAAQAFQSVIRLAGAMPRDSVDRRLMSEIVTGSGSIVEGPGRLPLIEGGDPPDDLDEDGMDDSWERAQGIDDNVYNPWEDHDSDGWLNLDEYLNYAHQRLLLDAGK